MNYIKNASFQRVVKLSLFESVKMFQLTAFFFIILQNPMQAQVNPKPNITIDTRISKPAETSKTILQDKSRIDVSNLKRINFDDNALAMKDFSALQQNEYSIISLKLPGNTEAGDYYVKKRGFKLILNDDIIVYDYAQGMSTRSYTRDDNKHTFGKDDLYRWPGGTVPVVLDNSVFVSNYNYNTIKAALDYFNYNTAIEFVERTNEEDYLVIKCIPDDKSGRAGASQVGRQRNGANIIEMVNGKFSQGNVMHELMHTLGVWHEQSRYDRDKFIGIKEDNITANDKYNFQIEGNSTARSAYDYCSIMHYSPYAFASNESLPTIVCKSNGVIVACPSCMGDRKALTKADIDGLNDFYRGIGINRAPSNKPFGSAKVPVSGCIGVTDQSILNKWNSLRDILGDCMSGQINYGIAGALSVQFQNGEVFHTNSGTFAVYGNIYLYYKEQGKLGKFGFPVSDELAINDADKGAFGSWNRAGYTRVSKFEKGVIVWGPQKKSAYFTKEKFEQGPRALSEEVQRMEVEKVN